MKHLLTFLFLSLCCGMAGAGNITFQVTAMAKKGFCYNWSGIPQTGQFTFHTKVQSYIEAAASYRFKHPWGVQAALAITGSEYWVHYDFRYYTNAETERTGIGTTTFKLPIRVTCNISPRLTVGAGAALNIHSFNVVKDRWDFYFGDSLTSVSYALKYQFKWYASVSAQVMAQYRFARRWSATALADWDMGAYPYLSNTRTYTTAGGSTFSNSYKGSPKMWFAAVGISYDISKKKKQRVPKEELEFRM